MADHITIGSDDPREQTIVGGTPQSTFTYLFEHFDIAGADILVYDGDTETPVSSAIYTITPNTGTEGGYVGGTIELDSAVTNTTITTELDLAYTRNQDFPTVGVFNITSLNTVLDRLTLIGKQLASHFSRSLHLPHTDANARITALPAAATRATKVLGFDSNGDPVVSTQTLATLEAPGTSAIDAAASAAAALVSEGLADADATQTALDAIDTAADVILADAARVLAEAAAAGIYWKAPVLIATTANISLTGEQTIDGELTSTSRILVKDQTATEENGIYITDASAWSRAAPMDTWDEHVGAVVSVAEGTVGKDTAWMCTVDAGGTLETTAIAWSAFGLGDMKGSNNLSDVASAATAFATIKQAATDAASGVVELLTPAEVATGSDTTRAMTAQGAAQHYSPIDRVTNDDTSTALDHALTDAGNVVFMNNAAANVFTVKPNASIASEIDTQIDVVQEGAGATTITADAGVTMNGVVAGSATLTGQFSGVMLIKRATNTWVLIGDHGGVA